MQSKNIRHRMYSIESEDTGERVEIPQQRVVGVVGLGNFSLGVALAPAFSAPREHRMMNCRNLCHQEMLQSINAAPGLSGMLGDGAGCHGIGRLDGKQAAGRMIA